MLSDSLFLRGFLFLLGLVVPQVDCLKPECLGRNHETRIRFNGIAFFLVKAESSKPFKCISPGLFSLLSDLVNLAVKGFLGSHPGDFPGFGIFIYENVVGGKAVVVKIKLLGRGSYHQASFGKGSRDIFKLDTTHEWKY